MRSRLFKSFIIGAVAVNMLCIGEIQTSAAEIVEPWEEADEIISKVQTSSQNLTVTGNTFNLTLIYHAGMRVDSIVVSARLQKYVDGKWERVKIWDDVKSSGMVCDVSKSCQVTSKGKFRAKFVVTTKKGNSENTENFYSNVVNY